MPAGTAEWLADAVRAHKESRPRRGGGASARAEAADEMRTEVTEHPCAKWVLEAPPGARVGRNSSSSQLSRSASAKPATKRAADAAPLVIEGERERRCCGNNLRGWGDRGVR